MKTIKAATPVSFLVGQVTLEDSCLTCLINSAGLAISIPFFNPSLSFAARLACGLCGGLRHTGPKGKSVAGAEGLEPSTFGFGDRRSAS